MRRIDSGLLASALLLTLSGLFVVYSTGGSTHLIRQLLFLVPAGIGFAVALLLPRRILLGTALPLYGLTLVLLILVFLIGTGPGSRRWFELGPVMFQPSELAKLATVVMLARYLSERRELTFSFRDLALPVLLVLGPALAILAEPDLSTALVLAAVLAAMLYWSGLAPLELLLLFTPLISFAAGFSLWLWLPFFVLLGAVMLVRTTILRTIAALATSTFFGLLSPLSLRLLKGYQADRIRNFLAPWFDPHGVGWNAIQSRIAIGSGRLLGKGFLHGTQNRLGFLPNRHTDFVFSCIGEEFGFLGSMTLLGLFALLVYRFFAIGRASRDRFASLICVGSGAIIAYQVFVNVGMLLGLLPITGITLPFISYGGSSLVLTWTLVGLAMNAARPE